MIVGANQANQIEANRSQHALDFALTFRPPLAPIFPRVQGADTCDGLPSRP